jgi:AraC-like DNA-binding protein
MKKLFLGILLTISGTAFCQNYTLPSVLYDSLVYETQRGRVCEQIRLLQTAQLINLSDLIDSKGKAIELLKTQTNALQGQVYNWEQTYQLNDQQHQAQNKHLKKSLLKWKLIAVAEVVLIVLVAL